MDFVNNTWDPTADPCEDDDPNDTNNITEQTSRSTNSVLQAQMPTPPTSSGDLLLWIKMIRAVCCELMDRFTQEEIPEEWELCMKYLYPDPSPYMLVDISRASKQALVALYFITITLAFLGNLCVIVAFTCSSQFRDVTNVFVLSLAASDLLITIFCMPFNIVLILSRTWDFGSFSAGLCKMLPYIQNVAVVANILTLACIAGERYLATLHPLRTRAIQTLPRTLLVVFFVWLFASVFSIPCGVWYNLVEVQMLTLPSGWPFSQQRNDYHESLLPAQVNHDHVDPYSRDIPMDSLLTTHNMCLISTSDRDKLHVYKWIFFLFIYLCPLSIMMFCYIRIGYQLCARQKVIGDQSAQSRQSDLVRMRTARRVLWVLVTVLVLFVVCWTPTILFELVALSTDMKTTEATMNTMYYLQWLALSNSCHNPFVYTFLHEKFRKNMSQLCRMGKNAISPGNSGNSHPTNTRTVANHS